MKNVLLAAFICLSLCGCSAKVFTIGMSEQDFIRHNKGAIQVEATRERTVYKKVDYGFGHPASVKFFYFSNGTLFQIDQGVRSPDVLIQHN